MLRGNTSPTTMSYIEISILLPPLITYACVSSDTNPKRKEQNRRGGGEGEGSGTHIKSKKRNKPPDGYFASLHLNFGTEEIVCNRL